MRLARIDSLEQAKLFLKTFIPAFSSSEFHQPNGVNSYHSERFYLVP